jgi:hypothetical protein
MKIGLQFHSSEHIVIRFATKKLAGKIVIRFTFLKNVIKHIIKLILEISKFNYEINGTTLVNYIWLILEA